jgi:methionyl-tRNA formyltransferase
VLADQPGQPGEVVATPRGPAVAAGQGALLLLEVQPPGKRPMPADAFARGARGFLGARLR